MKILVSIVSRQHAFTIPAAEVARLRARFPEHEFVHAEDPVSAFRASADAEVAFATHLPRDLIVGARALRWIHSPAAGVGPMLVPELVSSPIVVTNSRGLAADTIAEHSVAVVLALFRHLPLIGARQASRTWAQNEIFALGHRSLAGARVLLVGLGAIGAATARRFLALGADVTAVRRHADRGGPEGVRVLAVDHLHELLPGADVLILAAPDTRATQHLIDAGAIARLPPRAVLVNVGRGSLVDEPALVAALQSGRLWGAALDVFAEEPLDRESPLWRMPNVLITPHVAGFLEHHWPVFTDFFATNLERFTSGQPLLNVVDKGAGY